MTAASDDDEREQATVAETTEVTPLLRVNSDPEITSHVLGDPRALDRQNVIILTFIVIFLIDAGSGILIPPLNEMMEAVICRQAYPGLADVVPTGDPDSVCKEPDVQGKLVMTRAWMTTIECIPGILLAVPMGVLADKWGRRPIMFLAVLGIVVEVLLVLIIRMLMYPPTPLGPRRRC